MTSDSTLRRIPLVLVGIALLLLATVMLWETRELPAFTGHGLGAGAVPRLVAAGLAFLGVFHLLPRWRGNESARSPIGAIQVPPVLWICAGFALLALIVGVGGGFVPAIAVLFAAAGRGFGRRAVLVDLAIGAALALCVHLVFVKLLALTLPAGPLESLL